MSGFSKSLRCVAILVCGLLPSAGDSVFGQSTAWAPSRSATRPGTSAVTQAYDAPTPDWQRRPARYAVEATSHSAMSTQYNAAARYDTPERYDSSVRTARSPVRSNGYRTSNHQRIAYDVELNPGEQLVGQPTMSEGQSGAPKASAPRAGGSSSEFLPTPDGVSSTGNRFAPQGEVIHEGPHGGEEGNFDPGFDYENGNYEFEGNLPGSCTSCGDGNCGSCTGGVCHRDEWGDPTRCPDCGYYGYHRIGCGRVAMCLNNCLGPLVREWSIFAGTQGFKGPIDGGLNGNFGFNEGFNLAGPIIPWPRCGLGYQVGARWAQSNLSGTPFGTSSREQAFLTAGFFHRAYRNCGFQWGVAYDWMSDNYFDKDTFAQVRTELSYLLPSGHELGFLGMFGVKNTLPPNTLEQADQYNAFYRYTTEYGGQGRVWAGMTSHSLGIFGCDFRVPMSNRFDMVGGFNYIIPNDGANGNGQGGNIQESWGLAMNLVWYVGRTKKGIHNTPFRPLFNVADNNVMMLERP